MGENTYISDFETDAYRVLGSNNVVDGLTIDDTLYNDKPHRDGIQLIPTGKEPNAQYFGALAKNNTITNNQITSLGKLQGIFQSDGGQEHLIIRDNIIDTRGHHFITLNGLLSGTIKNNLNAHGYEVPVRLDNLRIGGGHEEAFYVRSFKDHEYKPIISDQGIEDMRGTMHRSGAKYVNNFDLNLFRAVSEATPYPHDGFLEHFGRTMKGYNDLSGKSQILTLDRFHSDNKATISRLSLNGEFLCHILEDEYRAKKVWGQTRIPAGAYAIGVRQEGGFHNRYTNRFKFHLGMLELLDVPHFQYILFHVGNTHSDTAGCLLTGRWNKSTMTVLESERTYERVYKLLIEAAFDGDLGIIIQDNDR